MEVRRLLYQTAKGEEAKHEIVDLESIVRHSNFYSIMNEERTEKNSVLLYELAEVYGDQELKNKCKDGKDYLFLIDRLYEMGYHTTVRCCIELLYKIPFRLLSFSIMEMWRGICDSDRQLDVDDIKEYLTLFFHTLLFCEDWDTPYLMLMKKHHYLHEELNYEFNDGDHHEQFLFYVKNENYSFLDELKEDLESISQLFKQEEFPQESRNLILKIEREGYRPTEIIHDDSIYGPEIDFILLCHSKTLQDLQENNFVEGKWIEDYIYLRDSKQRMGIDDHYTKVLRPKPFNPRKAYPSTVPSKKLER